MTSTYDLLEQEAVSHLKSVSRIISHLKKCYEAGDKQALQVLDSLGVSLRSYDFNTNPATGKNLAKQKAGRPFASAPCSKNNSDKSTIQDSTPETTDSLFTDRVKAIIRKAAEKNGQRMETSARGHAGTYIFNIDAEVFGEGIDKLEQNYKSELKEYLGGTMRNVQVTRVCHFIGHVVRMHVVNDSKLQLTDMTFAFMDYYKNPDTVRRKLSVKSLSYQEKEFFAFVNSSLASAKKAIYAQREQKKVQNNLE